MIKDFMNKKNKRQTGLLYEQQAAIYLEEQGYILLEHNYYCRLGEIDLIARDGAYLVFVEVKYRSTPGSGTAAESVNRTKQRRIYQCAQVYMKQHGISFFQIVSRQTDVILHALTGISMKTDHNLFPISLRKPGSMKLQTIL